MSAHRRIAAVVVRPTISWFGMTDETPMHVQTPGWMHALDWGRLLESTRSWFRLNGEGVVVIQLPQLAGLSTAGRRTIGAQLVQALAEAGWQTSTAGIETGWFTCLKEDFPPVTLGIGPWISQNRTPLLELGPAEPAVAVTQQLADYQRYTGGRWCGTGGLSGVNRIRNLREQQTRYGVPLWKWSSPDREVIGRAFELQGSRHNRDIHGDIDGLYVHHYDTRAMYLAAAAAAELGWSSPERRGPQEYDPARPGYWKVAVADLVGYDPMAVLVRPDRADDNGMVWLTTPVMQFLTSVGARPEIHDSLTSERSARILRGWAEQLRDALKHSGPALRPALKDTYARTVGMFARPTSRIYRPDWRDTIVDLAKCNLLRKTLHLSPLRYNIDSVWIPTTYADGRNGPLVDGGTIGAMRYEKTQTMTKYLTTYGAKK